jgi:hypothetical protein
MDGFVHSLWRCPYVDWCHVDSRGASGGILLMWDRRVVSRIDTCMGRYVDVNRNSSHSIYFIF